MIRVFRSDFAEGPRHRRASTGALSIDVKDTAAESTAATSTPGRDSLSQPAAPRQRSEGAFAVVNPTFRGLRRSSRIRTSGAKPDHSTVVANLDEIGVTPTDLARSVPAHFARRLPDDTDLAITDGPSPASTTSDSSTGRCAVYGQ